MEESKIRSNKFTSRSRKRTNRPNKHVRAKKVKLEEPVDDIIPPLVPFEAHFDSFLKDNAGFFTEMKTPNLTKVNKEYYKRRLLTSWKDPRIDLFKEEWIHDKRCLDIGCNEGVFTILIADKYSPHLIIGCDIDFKLIEKAIINLRKRSVKTPLLHPLVDTGKVNKIKNLIEKLPLSYQVALKNLETEEIKINEKLKDIVMFKQENYIANPNAKEKYDVVFCMSTSKWIHLTYGDIGIKALFYKIYNSLTNGGLFIFENEPWSSYKKKKSMDTLFKENCKNIKLRPHSFEKYLTVVLKFTLIEKLRPPALDTMKGYDRTILIFRK